MKYVVTIEIESEYISSETMNDITDLLAEYELFPSECDVDVKSVRYDWHTKKEE